MTEYGDAVLMPMLARLAIEENVPLALNRDAGAGYFTTNESSYFAYGKIVHKDGAFELASMPLDDGDTYRLLASGATMKEAAYIANYAAGIVVGKVGIGVVTPDELLEKIN